MPMVCVIYLIETFLGVRFSLRLICRPKERKSIIHGIQYRYIPIWITMYSVVGLNIVQGLLN